MIYLDNAATTWPKPESVYRALDEFARNQAGNPGRSGHRLARAAERVVQDCRGRLGRLLNAESPERVVLTLNATDALNIALKGILREGDHVITSHTEHNSINRPLAAMARAGRISFDRARSESSGLVPPEEVEKLVRPKTRLIAVTHCSNVLGVVNPIEEYARIAQSRGIRILVDASQTAGVVRIDVQRLELDLVALPGHKNLFGPMGTGALYVREGLALSPFREGATGYKSEEEFHSDEMPYRLEAGTPNAHGFAGLGAGLAFVDETGIDRIREHEQALALGFIGRLRENRKIRILSGGVPSAQLGPVSIAVEGGDPTRVGALLDERYGIACRSGLHCAPYAHRFLGTFPQGTIRFSFGWFNTPEHVDAAVSALNEIAA